MNDVSLYDITFKEIERFVIDRHPEGKSVDYKRDTYGSKDEDRKELLKDVSSFANTIGGDILIGIDEDKGEPTEIVGFETPNIDREKLRLEEIIRKGLEPRIDFGIHSIAAPEGRHVLVIRVKESLLAPHRVVFHGKPGEFWARSSAGKYSMDTEELRRAFTLSDSIYQQIREFREHRTLLVQKDEMPLPMVAGPRMILHLIPTASFRSRLKIDIANSKDLYQRFPTIGRSNGHRLNLDGYLTYGGGVNVEEYRSYTQLFRNGVVESVRAELIASDASGRYFLPQWYEEELVNNGWFRDILAGMKSLGIQPPVWCFMTITGVKGTKISTGDRIREVPKIDRDVLHIPECVIEDLSADPVSILKPLFDIVWNASGLPGCPNFDTDGHYRSR